MSYTGGPSLVIYNGESAGFDEFPSMHNEWMKVAIAGKGGSGKTTLAGTLARVLARRGERVLAIDADTNPNLAISLGIERESLSSLAALPCSLLQRSTDFEGKPKATLTMPIDAVMRDYGVSVQPELDLLVMARIDHAGAGWKCHAHATVRELTRQIASEARGHVVLDMEAGLEHLSRGTARNVDTLLVVAEPYFKSLETASRVRNLSAELGIPRIFVVANKVRPSDASSLNEFAERHSLEFAAHVPHDESVAEADRVGVAPIDYDAARTMVQQIDALADRLLAK